MSNLNGTWILDPTHTEIGFVARHAMVTKVRGNFQEFEAQVVVDGVRVSTVDTHRSYSGCGVVLARTSFAKAGSASADQ